jgi:alpha-mannosidase
VFSAAACAVTSPARQSPGPASAGAQAGTAGFSFVTCDRPGLVIDTVKPAFDGRGVVVRYYEAHGTRGPATLRFAHPVTGAEACNLLEDRTGDAERAGAHEVRLRVKPYELGTLRVVFAREGELGR